MDKVSVTGHKLKGREAQSGKGRRHTHPASQNSGTSATVGPIPWPLHIFAITLHYKPVSNYI